MNTEIKKQVLEYLLKIPKGKVSTYKKIWEKFSLHPRTIASIMKTNEEPEIYPCYKVISSNWNISWYSGEDWVSGKIKRLESEWIEVKWIKSLKELEKTIELFAN